MRASAVIIAICSLSLLRPSYAARERPSLATLPGLMLWAWERPEDLRGLDADVGVAFLAQTIGIAGDRIDRVPRRQPLRVSPAARLLAVTRIETSPTRRPSINAAPLNEIVLAIAQTARLPRVRGVQVDFDARLSERPFYAELLKRLRQTLDAGTPLSITALASWCMDDDWLEDLPIDEAVPMLFRMGPGERRLQQAGASSDLRAAACRRAVGTSLDEPIVLRAARKRVYVFNPRPWTDASIAEARRQGPR
jgi:hypothetical protein